MVEDNVAEESGHLRIPSAASRDTSAGDDTLGFAPYVNAVAEFLTDKDTIPPLTISVEGKWGSGKTSFMDQLRKKIDELESVDTDAKPSDYRHHFVWFNPWRYKKGEELWQKFALEFMRQTSTNRSSYEAASAYFKLMQFRIQPAIGSMEWRQAWLIRFVVIGLVLALFPAFIYALLGGKWADNAMVVWAIFAPIISLIETQKEWLKKLFFRLFGLSKADMKRVLDEKNIAFIDLFHEDFHKITKAFVGENSRTYVFIDDIDRCETPIAGDLMQWIHLMLSDEAKIVFIIGMDREKVAASIAAKHESILVHLGVEKGKGREYGYTFIEKFIQIPFEIPRPSPKDFHNYLNQMSKSNGIKEKKDGEEANRTVTDYESDLLRNLRKNINLIKKSKSPQTSPGPSQGGGGGTGGEIVDVKLLNPAAALAAQDSQPVKDVCMMVAEALDHNPRRLKMFLNLLRLKIFITYETGVLSKEGGAGKLTVQKLGKLLAVQLKWPGIFEELAAHPHSLDYMQNAAIENCDWQGNLAGGLAQFNGANVPNEVDDKAGANDFLCHMLHNRPFVRLLQAGAFPRMIKKQSSGALDMWTEGLKRDGEWEFADEGEVRISFDLKEYAIKNNLPRGTPGGLLGKYGSEEKFNADYSLAELPLGKLIATSKWVSRMQEMRDTQQTSGKAKRLLGREKREVYRLYFQELFDDLRKKGFTKALKAQAQSWYSFTSGVKGISYENSFARLKRVRVAIYIDLGDSAKNKIIFDKLFKVREEIEKNFGEPLVWERLDNRRTSRITIYRPGSIEEDEPVLKEIRIWSIERLLLFKKVLAQPEIRELLLSEKWVVEADSGEVSGDAGN